MWGRPACVLQRDQSDCGPAALATLALHYGRRVNLQSLREWGGNDQRGTLLKGLAFAAEKLGFSTRCVKASPEAIPHLPLPAVARMTLPDGRGHYVVIHKVGPNQITLADPAIGIRRIPTAEFFTTYSGYVLLAYPNAQTDEEISADPAGPWRRFVRLLVPHRWLLAEGFFCAVLMTILGLANSFFLQHLVDSVLVRNELRLLHSLGVGMVLVILFRSLFNVVRQVLSAHVGRKVDLSMNAEYVRHLMRLPLSFFESRQAGEILSRVNDASRLREAVGSTTLTAVVDGTLVSILLVVLFLYDVRLAAVATLFFPLLLLGVMLHQRANARSHRDSMEHAAAMSGHLIESVAGIETWKAYNGERRRTEECEGWIVRAMNAFFRLEALSISVGTIAAVITSIAGLVILWYGGTRVMAGALTIGQLMFFHSLLGYLLEPLQRLASVNQKIQETLVAVDRLYQVLDQAEESLDDPRKVKLDALRTGIELNGVRFRYGSRDWVLDRVQMAIPAGKTVAIVGESGSGKSTLLKLLMGFHHATEGSVTIDGIDQRDYDVASVRSKIGLVSQDPFVFSGTIRENIALGRPEADLDEVIGAARAAGLEEFVNRLPDRYETHLGERGVNLSGGQRQRLAIARALLRKPELLLFDEATSHLDTATERAIQDSLRVTLAGRTVLLIAHRLSTVKDADVIYVMHQGRVVEEGTHRQLMAEAGWYAKLWQAQTEEQIPVLHRVSERGLGLTNGKQLAGGRFHG
jgi:HlyB family type I secretion system ABC transporter